MSQHPGVEARITQELDEVGLLLTPERCEPRRITYADLARLPYLSAVIKVRPPSVRARPPMPR